MSFRNDGEGRVNFVLTRLHNTAKADENLFFADKIMELAVVLMNFADSKTNITDNYPAVQELRIAPIHDI